MHNFELTILNIDLLHTLLLKEAAPTDRVDHDIKNQNHACVILGFG
jgi:hypothetical protein